jgi:NADH-quinone oxidoreductase subunit E
MSLETKYPNEVKQILSKYPLEHKRSAVMPLLYLAQREEGYLSKAAMQDVAQIVGITETDIAALVGFYTLYHDKK